MKLNVKLLGRLNNRYPDYLPDQGLEVEIADGSKVGDLLAHLEISASQGGVVIREGRILPKEETLTDGQGVTIFSAMYGG
jgi:sulfur carrier protein ThiS